MWKRRFKKLWAAYRDVSDVRGLLQWLGGWKYVVLLSDSIVSYMVGHLASGTANLPNPIAVLVGLLCFALVLLVVGLAVALWRIVVEELPPKPKRRWPDLLLRMGMTNNGLLLWVENQTDHPIKDCALFLVQLQRYSEHMQNFTPQAVGSIWLMKPQTLSPGAESPPGYLAEIPHVDRGFLTTHDATGKNPSVSVRGEGIWRARINVLVSDKLYAQEKVFFKWKNGSMPEYIRDPSNNGGV